MSHPYQELPAEAFWRTAVSERNPLATENLWKPKGMLHQEDKVVTFGSCFAQHISKALQRHGFSWLDCEPGPSFASNALKHRFNYGVFSARTGNVYSAKALLQWVTWSLGRDTPPSEVWEKSGRFFDPFRPAIEPDGFVSAKEMFSSREKTLRAFERCVREADVFVFTLGLTESWENKEKQYTYATCPGTNAGTFDVATHQFRNYSYDEVHAHLSRALSLIRNVNPNIRILLTVSPVPLTATASGKHVVVSTTYSKSVLRAVAGHFSDKYPYVDYFPSYEIITAPNFRGMFYDPNMRTIATKGVDFVMGHFMAGMGVSEYPVKRDADEDSAPTKATQSVVGEEVLDDIKCEEVMLEAFSRKEVHRD